MRKLMWFTVGFGGACAFCSYLYVDFLLWIFLIGLLLALIPAFLSRYWKSLAPAALILLGISIGFGWFWCFDTAYLSAARTPDGETVPVTVTAADFAHETDYGTSVDGKITIDGRTYSVRAYLNKAYKLYPGSGITGNFLLRFTARGGEEDPTSHPGEGIYLLLYQRGDVTVSQPEAIPARYYPAVWRQLLLKKINEIFPSDTAGFVRALLLGDRSGIDYETNTSFKLSGISHIIAVSGLHVSILFGLLYTLTFRKRYLTALIGIPILILFAAVVGFTPSITRACIMQILMLLAMLTKREYDPPTALSFAVLTMLVGNPMTVISVSFQLSVGCMTGIFLFSGRIRSYLEHPKRLGAMKGSGILPRLKRWLASSVSVTVGACIVTTPLVAVYFGCVSLVSLLTNLLTLWIISVLFYGILLILLLSVLFPGAAIFLAAVHRIGVIFVLQTARLLADFPLSAIYTESGYIVIWLVGVYILLLAFLHCKEKYPAVFLCCAAVSLCVALFLSWQEPLLDHLRLTVLDVGQGQCILLQSEGKTFLVDCGGDSDTKAADKAAACLLSQGIASLDGIILTHYDDDHAAGVPYLLSRIGADAVYLPAVQDETGNAAAIQKLAADRAVSVTEDLLLTFGQTKLTVYASETTAAGNDSGLCILFQRENCDILITGDRGELGEALLLRRTDLPELDVLIAGHHGSKTSTGEALLARGDPETVIISVGKDNSYGHPAPALLDRLSKYGCILYRTDENGTVIYRR